jgi:DNA primase
MNEVEEIKGRLDLVDLISQYVVLKKAGTNYKGVCPFHQEKTPSMMVSPQKQIWKCFGCGKGGDHYTFVMEAEHLEFGDALRLLAQKAGVTLQPRTTAEHQSQGRKELLYRVNKLAAAIFQKVLFGTPEGKAALAYLESRQISTDSLKEFGVGFASKRISLQKLMASKGVTAADLQRAGSPEKFFDRIIFPIYDVLGNVIAFTGRSLGDVQPKYLNSPETQLFSKSRVLYGLHLAKAGIKKEDRVILVEGQLDVIALHQAGVTEVVASSGTAVTEQQLQILSKYTQNFVLGFDGDAAGVSTTEKVVQLLLKNDLSGRVLSFGSYKDAGELFEKAPKTWADTLKSATEMVDWLINQKVRAVGSLQFIENKKKLTSMILPTLQLIPDATRLDYYVQRLASLLQVSSESLYTTLKKTSQPKTPDTGSSRVVEKPPTLTNEEQLLALLLSNPSGIKRHLKKIEDVVWQSMDAELIASSIKKWYTDETLVKNPSRFSSQVKTDLDSRISEKIDSWQFWLSSQWEQLSPALTEELLQEKFSQLSTKQYDQQKSALASGIQQAQQAGDLTEVKRLMNELNELSKQNKENNV